MSRRSVMHSFLLAASSTLDDVTSLPITDGHLSIHAVIDDGAGGSPTDEPVGTWELWFTSDGGETFYLLERAGVTLELAEIAPDENTLVSEWAIFSNVPGSAVKLRYNRGSGGGDSARAVVHMTA